MGWQEIANRVFRLALAAPFCIPYALAEIDLPTPEEHYLDYDARQEALQLAGRLLGQLPAEKRREVFAMVSRLRSGADGGLSAGKVEDLLEAVDWRRHRGRILEIALHTSQVLEIVPPEASRWRPVVHDALLFFLDNLSEERLVNRLLDQLSLPRDAPRGERMLRLARRTPSLQKLGQILARNQAVPEDIRDALQTLENSIQTAGRDHIVDYIVDSIGEDAVRRYRIEFSDELLAEASVGAVIRVAMTLPGEDVRREAVCKVIKQYAVEALDEDLQIMAGLAGYFEKNAGFYGLGQVPLSEMFGEVHDALSREIQVVEEQKNLRRAREYFQSNPWIKVPRIYPPRTDRVTFMEFIDGVKVTEAFAGNPKKRKEVARRLNDLLILDVIFAEEDVSLFHGDPHAGNVFFYDSGSKSPPYQIALLDWGLAGTLPRKQRKQLVQLLLGVQIRDEDRLLENLGALVEGPLPRSREKRIEREWIVENVMAAKGKQDPFSVLSDLITRLAKAGYKVNFQLALYVKSQITLLGILQELNPEFELAPAAAKRVGVMVLKETPKRLLNTVYFPNWTKHPYPSMLSNEDVRDAQFHLMGRGFKKLGGWIWAGVSFPARAFR